MPGHDSLCVHTVDRVDRAILQPGVSLIKLPHITSLSMQLTHCTRNMEENVLLIRFSGGASAMLKSIAFYNDSLTLLLEPFCGYYFIFYVVPRPTFKSNTPIDKEPNHSAHNKNKSNISF